MSDLIANLVNEEKKIITSHLLDKRVILHFRKLHIQIEDETQSYSQKLQHHLDLYRLILLELKIEETLMILANALHQRGKKKLKSSLAFFQKYNFFVTHNNYQISSFQKLIPNYVTFLKNLLNYVNYLRRRRIL